MARKISEAKRLRHRRAMDAVLKELFAGGPMKASFRGGRRTPTSASVEPMPKPRKMKWNCCLEAEHKRLVRLWGRG